MTVIDRLRGRSVLDLDTGCWLWMGPALRGYGQMHITRETKAYVHRVAYEHLVEPIPEGLQLDHLCRRTNCWNPTHLEPVTPRENTLRASALVTHCPKGHAYTDENTWRNAKGHRFCRTCDRARKRERYAQRGRAA